MNSNEKLTAAEIEARLDQMDLDQSLKAFLRRYPELIIPSSEISLLNRSIALTKLQCALEKTRHPERN